MSSSKTLLITGVSSGFGRRARARSARDGPPGRRYGESAEARRDFESLSARARAIERILDVTDFDAIDGVVANRKPAWARSMCS